MLICPRCKLEQDESPQCEYCGLDFSGHSLSGWALKVPRKKQRVFWGLILVISVALVASYWLFFAGTKPVQSSKVGESSSSPLHTSGDENLRTVAKELAGDVGVVGELTGDSTKGSVIAMVVFSIIGLGYLSYGKKSQRLLMVVCGIGLMGFSYFVDGTLYIILIGLVLSALPVVLSR